MKTKKVIKAIKSVRKYCKKQTTCLNCGLNGIGFCGVVPDGWNIKEIEKKFKDMERI